MPLGPWPKWLYAQNLPPIIVADSTSETAANAQGYGDTEPASPSAEPDFGVPTYNPPPEY